MQNLKCYLSLVLMKILSLLELNTGKALEYAFVSICHKRIVWLSPKIILQLCVVTNVHSHYFFDDSKHIQ